MSADELDSSLMVDIWCRVVTPERNKLQGRLIQHDDDLLTLFGPNGKRATWQFTEINNKRHTATLTEGGELAWMKTCTCSQPASLKGPASQMLATLQEVTA